MPDTLRGAPAGRRLDLALAAICLAVVLAVILPVGWQSVRMDGDIRLAQAKLVREQQAIVQMNRWAPLLFDLQHLRAASSHGMAHSDAQRRSTDRVAADADAVERAGAVNPRLPACGTTWTRWRRDFRVLSGPPDRTALTRIVSQATCFSVETVASSDLVYDADATVQVLASLLGYNGAGLLRRLGEAAASVEAAEKSDRSRPAVLAAARSVGYVTRLQSNIDAIIREDEVRNDAGFARELDILAGPMRARVALFAAQADTILVAPHVKPGAVAALDRLALAAADAGRPVWQRGLAELGRRVGLEQRALARKTFELFAFAGSGVGLAFAFVMAAARFLDRRHRRQVERIVLERDALAAQLARAAAERALSITEGQLHAVFESSLDGIGIFDPGLRVVQANSRFRALLAAYSELEEVARRHATPVFATLEAQSRVEHCVTTSRGPAWLSLALVGVFDQQRCVYAIATISDITETKAHEARLVEKSERDALTQLSNRAGFEQRLSTAVSAHRPFALAFVDLDAFKPINDTYGHAAGDAVLATVGARLRATVSVSDAVARIGGDEFALILRDVSDICVARSIARRLTRAIALPMNVHAIAVNVRASIGIVVAGAELVSSGPELMAQADAAMYRAKTQGLGYVVESDLHRFGPLPVLSSHGQDSGFEHEMG